MDVLSVDWQEGMMTRRPKLGTIQRKPADHIPGSAYAPESLEAAIWSFLTTGTFRDPILAATNVDKINLMPQSLPE